MAIPFYLAMTAAEMENAAVLPAHCGWMACHFSLSSPGLTNLPKSLAPGTLLMLDDANPVSGHDPALVAQQLRETAEQFSCAGILLDFQRFDQTETAAMAAELCRRLPGQVTASAACVGELSCPVCLPPVPCSVPLPEYLAPWKDRQIWLEGGRTKEIWEVTEQGANRREILGEPTPEQGFWEEALHCHYIVTKMEESFQFTLWRTAEDLEEMKIVAEKCGVTALVGLWQELGAFPIM